MVHAGDPDREGQLLVDEVLDYGFDGGETPERAPLSINDLNPQAVARAVERLRDNRDFIPLCVSALARSRADWLYGINMTRAYTLLGRNAGYDGVLSVGRVQTPVLGLVVRRDEEIENFVPKDFFEVKAHIVTPKEERFVALWQPSDSCEPYQDEEGRLLHRPLAEHVVKRIEGQPATVTAYNDKRNQIPHRCRSRFHAANRGGPALQPQRATGAGRLPAAVRNPQIDHLSAFRLPLSAGRTFCRPPRGAERHQRAPTRAVSAAGDRQRSPQPLLGR